jgi:spore coat polysaccharide biosynthesis protein SpsF
MDLGGKPLLQRLIERVNSTGIFTVLATPDIELVTFAADCGVSGYLGSENDVLDRYYTCAKCFDIDPIIRITGDNPLIRTSTITRVINEYNTHFDWVSNCRLVNTYPKGDDLEIFSFQALEKAWLSTQDRYNREHVTPYIYNHPEIFRLKTVLNSKDESNQNWSVDTLEDLERVRKIYAKQERNRKRS